MEDAAFQRRMPFVSQVFIVVVVVVVILTVSSCLKSGHSAPQGSPSKAS